MYIIAGLGNPTKEYDKTRHNIGFDVIDALADEYGIRVDSKKHKALVGNGTIAGQKVVLAKPQTFMNLSGESLRALVDFYKVPIENVLIIYDDISLDVGRLRIRAKGSAGGHNGIKNIIERSGTDVFPRIKVGVGAPKGQGELVGWVLGSFSKEETEILSESIDRACKAVEEIIKAGCASAAQKYN